MTTSGRIKAPATCKYRKRDLIDCLTLGRLFETGIMCFHHLLFAIFIVALMFNAVEMAAAKVSAAIANPHAIESTSQQAPD